MTDNASHPKLLELRPANENQVTTPVPEHKDTSKGHHIVFYGMWIGLGWVLSKGLAMAKRAIAEDLEANIADKIAGLKDLTGNDGPAEIMLQSSGRVEPALPEAFEVAGSGEFSAYGVKAVSAELPGVLHSEPIGPFGAVNTVPAATGGGSYLPGAAKNAVINPLQPLSLPDQVAPSQPVFAQDFLQPFNEIFPLDGELHLDLELTAELLPDGLVPLAGGLPGAGPLVIGGDFYDVQISFDYGLLKPVEFDSDGLDISFGSTLNSAAAEFDAVVIGGDLIEINAIVQYSALVQTEADLLPDWGPWSQVNEAVIAEYSDRAGKHFGLGDEINVTTIEQSNIAEEVVSGVQTNDAIVFEALGDAFDAGEVEFDPGDIESLVEDLFPDVQVDEPGSILGVAGSYHEVNLVVQMSGAAPVTGEFVQSNAALINDFDGVAHNQFVAGDEIDFNSIAQLNYVSKAGDGAPDWLGGFLGGKGGNKGHDGKEHASKGHGKGHHKNHDKNHDKHHDKDHDSDHGHSPGHHGDMHKGLPDGLQHFSGKAHALGDLISELTS